MFVAAGLLVAAVAELVSGLAGAILGVVFVGVLLWRSWGLWKSWKDTGSVPREPENPPES